MSIGDEVIWPVKVAEVPINSEPHRRRRAFSQPSLENEFTVLGKLLETV
jgi:hypothetical protein